VCAQGVGGRSVGSGKERRLVKEHGKIFWHYLKGWFAMDFVASVPYDMIMFRAGASGGLRMLRMVRLVRVLRLGRVKTLVSRFVGRLVVNYAVLALCQFACFLLLSIHWVACVWGAVASCRSGAGLSSARVKRL